MKFRPLHDRVLVRRVEQEEKTSGGIIIPETAKEKPQEGEIVAAGPGAGRQPGQNQTGGGDAVGQTKRGSDRPLVAHERAQPPAQAQRGGYNLSHAA